MSLFKLGAAFGLTWILLEALGVCRCKILLSVAALMLVYLIVKRESVLIFLSTARRDLFGARMYAKMMRKERHFMKHTKSVHAAFKQVAALYPSKACFLYEKQPCTYAELEELSTRIAFVMRDSLKLKTGDSVALIMPNKPQYVAIWLGAAKLGCITALVNTNVRNDALLHSFKAANCRLVIFDQEYASAIDEVREKAQQVGVQAFIQWQHTKTDDSFEQEIAKLKTSPADLLAFEPHKPQPNDPLVYIYTSGTTGLPKAAVVRHFRFYLRATMLSMLLKITPADIVYNPLPLYHTSGGVLGVGFALVCGVTVAIRSKFSASQFWEDCIANRCTAAQYIGEMCRYLMAQPEKAEDKQHRVRIMIGNGLRRQIWQQFTSRFQIKEIGEFYGATEGNSGLLNYSNKVGACGFFSKIFARPIGIIKVDDDGEPIRDQNGMCIPCKVGEPGQLVAGIVSTTAHSDFDGYTDPKATERKIIANVFARGDRAFSSGDILETDKEGFVYFVDRIGDTFRWKGENVSTTEVESALSGLIGVEEDVIVYGVQVPGCEGRAGMATLTKKGSQLVEIDSAEFYASVQKRLPAYARPLFIRVVPEVESTGTFKLKKSDLRALSFKPHKNDVSLYFANREKSVYQRLDEKLFEQINNGSIAL